MDRRRILQSLSPVAVATTVSGFGFGGRRAFVAAASSFGFLNCFAVVRVDGWSGFTVSSPLDGAFRLRETTPFIPLLDVDVVLLGGGNSATVVAGRTATVCLRNE